jgi:exosome complex component RRP4
MLQCEVQQYFSDGAVALHTRSSRYGRLGVGQLVQVPSALVRRGKTAFAPLNIDSLETPLELLLAANGTPISLSMLPVRHANNSPGYIWIGPAVEHKQVRGEPDEAGDTGNPNSEVQSHEINKELGAEVRRAMARVANSIVALRQVFAPISPPTIMQVYQESMRLAVHESQMLLPANLFRITAVVSKQP